MMHNSTGHRLTEQSLKSSESSPKLSSSTTPPVPDKSATPSRGQAFLSRLKFWASWYCLPILFIPLLLLRQILSFSVAVFMRLRPSLSLILRFVLKVLQFLILRLTVFLVLVRSEERRVGKECRSRWSREE